VRIETERLILREWREEDRAPFAAYNADPETRRYYYPPVLMPAEVNAFVDGMIADLAVDGFSFLAVERKADGAFIGETGLTLLDPAVRDTMERPCPVEIGWFLGRPYWGQGYATEAARAWIAHAFGPLGLPELVSIICAQNAASLRLAEKLGMARDPQPFEDPTVPVGHWQRPHVIYRLKNPGA
jgi:RimJ/RimL family protein N-acetyltransferase